MAEILGSIGTASVSESLPVIARAPDSEEIITGSGPIF